MNYKSVADLNTDMLNNIHRIPRDIDLIVGVPRSGLLIANMIALLLNLQITDVDGFLSDKIIDSGSTKKNYLRGDKHHVSECQKVLVIEDTVYSGASLLSVKKRIEEKNLSCEVLYFAAYVMPGKEYLVDIYFQTLAGPRVFEWNIFHSGILGNSCVDIDGVLCVDPTEEENDDGDRYRYFLEHAVPKIIPTRQVKYLVSSRLEKYRAETERWLERNNISYEKLFLLDSTAEERRENGLHKAFKSKIYGKSDCILFIESSAHQAKYINDCTGKPVYCIENNLLYDGNTNDRRYEKRIPPKRKTLRAALRRSPALKRLYKRLKAIINRW